MPAVHEGESPRSRSVSPPSSPPRMNSDDAKTLKMKSPEELLANPLNPMDLLKNSPFLMPAQLLALNPQLYAAQLAQLQAAQIMLAKQTLENSANENGDNHNARKRVGDDIDSETKHKQPRSSSPKPGAPLDLSSIPGAKSPPQEVKPADPMGGNYFNPMMQAGLLNFFNQLQRPPLSGAVSSAGGSPPSPSPPSRHSSPWQAQWANRNMRPPVSSPVRPSMPMSSPTLSSPPRGHDRDVLREQMPIPRKLVRGQDVWIGRADEQTRDILKCMGCGESFRTLDLLTKHMQATQHYKKVISHDQISTWKYNDPPPAAAAKSPVNSVLSCKVCDKGFSSLKDLSDHMVRNNHYAGAGPGASDPKIPRNQPPTMPPTQAARDRKKSLPVKKLLELERARQEVAGNKSPVSSKEIMESGKLMCERCEEKIPIDIFIPHIQQCVGRPRFLKATMTDTASSPSGNKDSKAGSKSETKDGGNSDGSSSILGSLEQLVKGNFTSSASTATAASKILPPISSPITTFPPPPQSSPLGKFNINNLFPVARSVSPPSSPNNSSHNNSKPGSPTNSHNHTTTNNNLVQPSLEKMLDSPIEPVSSPINGTEAKNSTTDRQSPFSEKSRSSPRTHDDDEKHIPAMAVNDDSNSSVETKPRDAGSNSQNALAALQSFCNDQTKPSKTQVKETNIASNAAGSPMSDPGAILAFSWAVNQAANAGGDSAIKCPFCDTPFISKGAYRHHLSKMHFTKENLGNISANNIPQVGALHGRAPGAGAVSNPNNRTPSPEAKDAEESLQSKYQKYSQLAKQLSCYDGTN